MDDQPRFHLDALRWFACLTEVVGVDPSDLVVHVVGPASSDALTYLASQGVAVQPIPRFDPRSPHCNKVAGALQMAEDGVDGLAVLCDADLAVLEDPRAIDLPDGAVAGKPVDAPVPPLETILAIFGAAGLTVPPTVDLSWDPGSRTVSGNSNGGLYLVPGHRLGQVAAAWERWARWLLDRRELLEDWGVYVDQVSMAMGLAEEGIDAAVLDVHWNMPTHDPTRIPADAPQPAVIHYHQEVDAEGRIRPVGSAPIDAMVDRANQAITEVWRRARPEKSSIELRRLQAASVVASEVRGRQRQVVEALVGALDTTSVLEINGGDRQPSGRPTTADLVVALGADGAHGTAGERHGLGQLWSSAHRALVVSASAVGAGHGAELEDLLDREAPGAERYPVLGGEGSATFVVLRTPEPVHPRDYSPETLAAIVDRHPDPLGLAVLRLHARTSTTFYPDHAPRLWEYPIVARLVTEGLPPGRRLLDIGAGVTPLTPFLTSRDYQVDTVDPSPVVREWPPKPEWNEWDYLDYGAAGLARRSWNCTLDRLPSRPPWDGAYSVSVIEHMPAADRRSLLREMARRTRSGGLVVLTIDLMRGSEALWNRNLGVEVEGPGRHGTLDDVTRECARVGLQVFRRDVVRDWGDVQVDIGLLALRRTDRPVGPAWPDSVRRLGSAMRGRAGDLWAGAGGRRVAGGATG